MKTLNRRTNIRSGSSSDSVSSLLSPFSIEMMRRSFVRALSLDQFSPLLFSSCSSNAEDSQDGEDSQNGEEEQQEESDNAND